MPPLGVYTSVVNPSRGLAAALPALLLGAAAFAQGAPAGSVAEVGRCAGRGAPSVPIVSGEPFDQKASPLTEACWTPRAGRSPRPSSGA